MNDHTSTTTQKPAKRQAPASFFALGHAVMPQQIAANGITYQFLRLFKHDFFAATALYQRADAPPVNLATIDDPAVASALAVLKIQRTQSIFGFPMRWLGQIVANREIAIYHHLQGIPGIPAFLGNVGPTGFLHAYIPGRDLEPSDTLSLRFFQDLQTLLSQVHARRIAYVDTNKRENILRGVDDRPYLIDFQISFDGNRRPWRWFGFRWVLAHLQHKDQYHYYKHKTRLIPQFCSPDDNRLARPPLLIRLHRLIAQPFIRTRRRFLARYDLVRTR